MNINDALAKEYNRGLADGKASVEQKHGHWEQWAGNLEKCSVCGYEYTDLIECRNYCGNCGAKMDEVTE